MPRESRLISATPALIDIHCHQYSDDIDHIQILSRDMHEVTDNDDICVKSSLDQPFNQTHADLMPCARYLSLGIHPWFIAQQNIDSAFQALDTFKQHPKLLAIGECGLDNCIETPLPVQIEIFRRQIELAERIGKPLLIHCVRAFSELLQLKKQLRPNRPWIIHGFSGKPALAVQLIKQGCYLSFGAALLKPGSHASDALENLPIERLFLETDTAELSIGAIYAAAAKIRGTESANLRQQIHNNFLNVFFND